VLTAERSLAAVGWGFLSDLLVELQDFLNELLGNLCNITFGRIFLEHKLRPCDIRVHRYNLLGSFTEILLATSSVNKQQKSVYWTAPICQQAAGLVNPAGAEFRLAMVGREN